MNLTYELWDYATGNCIGAYADQSGAFADVLATIRRYGDDAATSLVLLTAPDDGEAERIAAGIELIEQARAAEPLALKSSD
jgi:hypothetical protein